ncbi:hypothetical protein GCM10025879_02580 [Leuconostoc litchii]|nr:hypothetical protein GCM10025879_02580 [Leuconostoc litchii]
MIVRLENGIQLKNPLLKEIKTNYSNYFTDTKRYIKWSSYLSQFDINDDEIAYLVLHLLATVEKYKNLNKPRTLIICATGYGSAQLLNNRLEKEFSKYLNIVDIKGYYEIDDSILNNIDLIISTIDLSTQVFKVPVIQVSVFLTETDVQKLNQYLDNQRMHAKQKKFITDREIDTKPTFNYFDQFASDSRFKIWHTPTNKNTVLKELIEKISSEETQDFQDELLKQINQREALSAITFSDTIVVPHPAIPMSHVPKIAIGITPKGLKWSEEYPNIKFVFLLSPSYWNNRGLTETTQAIVRLTEDVEKQNDLIISKSFSEFRDTFLSMIEGGTSA